MIHKISPKNRKINHRFQGNPPDVQHVAVNPKPGCCTEDVKQRPFHVRRSERRWKVFTKSSSEWETETKKDSLLEQVWKQMKDWNKGWTDETFIAFLSIARHEEILLVCNRDQICDFVSCCFCTSEHSRQCHLVPGQWIAARLCYGARPLNYKRFKTAEKMLLEEPNW